MKPLRILFVTHSFPPPDRPLDNIGGMQRVAFELHAALQGRLDAGDESFEYEVHALVSSWRWVHVRIVPFLLRTWMLLSRRRNVDVVLFSSMVTAALAVPLKRRLSKRGIKTAAIVHGQDVTKPVAAYQSFVPTVFAALDAVMPVSAATGEQCVARGLPPERVSVVHNGVDVARFDSMLARLESSPGRMAHERRALPDGALLLCSVGRQVPRKGFAWFIRNVMPELPPHIHYWLGGDGPQRDDIQAAIAETGLDGRVRMLGRLNEEELVDVYRSSDLFVMPNIPVAGDMEGFGIVMLEAGLCGLPTIAAHLEGIREVIEPGQNGWFVPSGDVAGYVARILELDADRPELEALSTRTASHVRRTFAWDTVAANYVRALSRLSSH